MDTEVIPAEEPEVKIVAAKRGRSLINARITKGLDQAEQMARVAKRESIAAALEAEEFPRINTDTLIAEIAACRTQIALFISTSGDKQVATNTEKTLRLTMIGLLQLVQTAARRKWARSATERDRLKAYYIGISLKSLSYAALTEAADVILRQARQDALPGFTADKLAALETAILQWTAKNAAQSEAQNISVTARAEVERLFENITTRRIELQLAADATFPYFDKSHTATRTEFGLPKNGPHKTV